jgi:hypothetical protein
LHSDEPVPVPRFPSKPYPQPVESLKGTQDRQRQGYAGNKMRTFVGVTVEDDQPTGAQAGRLLRHNLMTRPQVYVKPLSATTVSRATLGITLDCFLLLFTLLKLYSLRISYVDIALLL